jgi:hypothetical protein
VGQASSLSVRDDRQDAGPTSNLSFGGTRDCFAALAMTVFSLGDLRAYKRVVAIA